MAEVAVRGLGGFESPVRRLSVHSESSANSSVISDKGLTEETLSVHSNETEVAINETTVADNLCHKMLTFVNSKKRESESLFKTRDDSAKVVQASTKAVSSDVEKVDREYVNFLKANQSRIGIISRGLEAGFDSRSMLSPMVVKLKEKSDLIKAQVKESFNIASEDLEYRKLRIPELVKQLEVKGIKVSKLESALDSSKFDEVKEEGIELRLKELHDKKNGFELPQPPDWVSFFGTRIVKIYAFFQKWAWERHGIGKLYREASEEFDRLNEPYMEFVGLNSTYNQLKKDIVEGEEELEELRDGYKELQDKTKILEHLSNNVVGKFFTEQLYAPFKDELEAAKKIQDEKAKEKSSVKKTTIKSSQVDLRASTISTSSTRSSESSLISSAIFDSGSNIRTSQINYNQYNQVFSNKMREVGSGKLEAMVAENSKIRENAAEIRHAFSEVARIFSSPYVKNVPGALSSEISSLAGTADVQAGSYQGFVNSLYNFAERVEKPTASLFENNKRMARSMIDFTESDSQLSKFERIDKAATLLISDNVEDKYSKLYRSMPVEFRKEYLNFRYSEELKEQPRLPVSRFTSIVSDTLKLNQEEQSEVSASFKSDIKPVEIVSSSSLISEFVPA